LGLGAALDHPADAAADKPAADESTADDSSAKR
jgi:hypothetical protein